MCQRSLWAACGRVIINKIVAWRCIVTEPTTSPEQHDGELRNTLEQIQSVMAVRTFNILEMPFNEVLSHAMTRDVHGREMSKSLGIRWDDRL